MRARALACLMIATAACAPAVVEAPGAPARGDASHAALAAMTSADCGACHGTIEREWRGSRHASAWTDPLVATEYRAAPDRRCVGCHAPLTDERAELPRGRAAHDGIDCRTCHVDGDDAGATLIAGASLARAELCGRCHQFRLPGPVEPGALAYDPQVWLQDTLGEWARSEAARAGTSCRDCHMPEVGEGLGRHRSHDFPGMLDPSLVREAVEVELRAARDGGVILVDARLRPGRIGHAFPTGDLFREAVFRVWTEEEDGDVEERLLKRWFAVGPRERDDQSSVLSLVDDTRVPPPGGGEAPHYELRLRSPAARSVAWSLVLHANGNEAPAPTRQITVASGRVLVR